MVTICDFTYPDPSDGRFPEYMSENYRRILLGHLANVEILEWLIENAEPTKSELNIALQELEIVKETVSNSENVYSEILSVSESYSVSRHFISDEIEARIANRNDLFFGDKLRPEILLDKILETCIGFNSMADLCEWKISNYELSKTDLDSTLEYLHNSRKKAAYFEDKHEELRKIFNLPDNVPILNEILLKIRKTEPIDTNIPLLDKYMESLHGSKENQ